MLDALHADTLGRCESCGKYVPEEELSNLKDEWEDFADMLLCLKCMEDV